MSFMSCEILWTYPWLAWSTLNFASCWPWSWWLLFAPSMTQRNQHLCQASWDAQEGMLPYVSMKTNFLETLWLIMLNVRSLIILIMNLRFSLLTRVFRISGTELQWVVWLCGDSTDLYIWNHSRDWWKRQNVGRSVGAPALSARPKGPPWRLMALRSTEFKPGSQRIAKMRMVRTCENDLQNNTGTATATDEVWMTWSVSTTLHGATVWGGGCEFLVL